MELDVNLAKAETFLATHARVLDRHRFAVATGMDGSADALRAALAAYRNGDGGFGWGLEPDLRSRESQPAGALHALEVLEEAGSDPGGLAPALCDWLDSVTLTDGGLPFALPVAEPVGTAPWWRGADPAASSLHITAAVAAAAHRLARHDKAVRDHAWLARVTAFCLREIAERPPASAYELRYVLAFLDAIQDAMPETAGDLARLAARLPEDGTLPVEGGLEGEALHPLDISPWPDRPLRRLLPADVMAADLRRLAAGQRDDGGWTVDFAAQSPASALEWRGHATVNAIRILFAHRPAA
ncbi:hypothetical protein Skr01_31040 [Sphaerisporangium krabiense]|uniref:Uncharacterized protein n=1 Tax=Sphaerisporangium krabiense TaxID=763782 RepID=A0A7W9DPR8_9ACTN|nr:hypothetical protein [Sphaerisporangium krabiense]MBB5625645.1 hypothetical protein [Sphaerisporangium krabiense]GII63019.1 hypothetical protein Skr01_31040 [Sphaerisporangium krabiense]